MVTSVLPSARNVEAARPADLDTDNQSPPDNVCTGAATLQTTLSVPESRMSSRRELGVGSEPTVATKRSAVCDITRDFCPPTVSATGITIWFFDDVIVTLPV